MAKKDPRFDNRYNRPLMLWSYLSTIAVPQERQIDSELVLLAFQTMAINIQMCTVLRVKYNRCYH